MTDELKAEITQDLQEFLTLYPYLRHLHVFFDHHDPSRALVILALNDCAINPIFYKYSSIRQTLRKQSEEAEMRSLLVELNVSVDELASLFYNFKKKYIKSQNPLIFLSCLKDLLPESKILNRYGSEWVLTVNQALDRLE